LEKLLFQSLTRATDHSDHSPLSILDTVPSRFNPSHGPPIIPTSYSCRQSRHNAQFQSLTRATDHSDVLCKELSICQCKMFQSLTRATDHSDRSYPSSMAVTSSCFNPSHGLPIIPTQFNNLLSTVAILVSIPHTGYRSFRLYRFSPVHLLHLRFQSLTRATDHSDAEAIIEKKRQKEFQSLTRATDHSDPGARADDRQGLCSFNPSHGLPIIPTNVYVLATLELFLFQSLTRATDHSD